MPTAVAEVKGLQGKARRRFYEPLAVLEALSFTSGRSPSEALKIREPSIEGVKGIFKAFVYRLAYVCSSHRGPKTITSIAVMEDDNSFFVVFACNEVSSRQGRRISDHIEELLDKVANASRGQTSSAKVCRDDVLKTILFFNRDRVETYLERVVSFATKLLETISIGPSDTTISESLKGLASCLRVESLRKSTDGDYLRSCLDCLEKIKIFLKAFRRSPGYNEEMATNLNAESWSELKHCISRVLAYEEAMKSLFKARDEWPQLFERFKILHIPSSTPGPNLVKTMSRNPDVEAIIGRMTNDPDDMHAFREYARDMRKFDLDERIRQKCSNVRPFIHAEVLVQDWIEREGYQRRLRFFNDWKYIGCSKPPCRMCAYYFEACGSDIELRASHGNIYANWQFPDAHGPGRSASTKWQKALNSTMEKIRRDAFKVMAEKCSAGKKHDSITYDFGSAGSTRHSQAPERSIAESVRADDGSESDTAEVGDLLRDRLTLESHDNGDGDDDDDGDEGGGALL